MSRDVHYYASGTAKQDHVIKLLHCKQFSVSVVMALAII